MSASMFGLLIGLALGATSGFFLGAIFASNDTYEDEDRP